MTDIPKPPLKSHVVGGTIEDFKRASRIFDIPDLMERLRKRRCPVCKVTHLEAADALKMLSEHNKRAHAQNSQHIRELEEIDTEIERLRSALQETIPVVRNARDDPDASPWQKETRNGILIRVEKALGGK